MELKGSNSFYHDWLHVLGLIDKYFMEDANVQPIVDLTENCWEAWKILSLFITRNTISKMVSNGERKKTMAFQSLKSFLKWLLILNLKTMDEELAEILTLQPELKLQVTMQQGPHPK